MRVSVAACALGGLGALGFSWLIGLWAFGLVGVVLSGLAIVWGLLHDDGEPVPGVHQVPGQGGTVADVLERARRAG
jgi:hypothetical protein